ncbi:3-isopropylmalate dehydratase, small subunit [Alkaliphilus metalliredigens QYMF]|uniref:3-isopropylmalate dehydratase small subunit n=1 Tax=Alkaliphilus metalliredigens (strain QYMF) TaxID=293826 RepID=A6TSE4_ALKMQ|nr:3-isopropylmalate dehydratase small subunit [Alkaliphilus metalliredigens]ABR49112.1 3-isopropylmalate dehydratase, small subunit [Alkaliphilus metalliredigens QYMF]
MKDLIKGKAIVVGKNIDTDQIYPGRYLELVDPNDIAKHAMEGVDPNFYKRFNPGDIIVADKNFGCGSSREHAVITLKTAGVAAVIAPSFARIFYRNAINLGLPLITCANITEFVKEGEELEVTLSTGTIKNNTVTTEIQGDELPPFVLEMISYGGIKQYYIHKHEEK